MPADAETDLAITLDSPLTLGNAFRFPLQSAGSRKDLFIGGAVLLLPVLGWLLNMGHRIEVTHRLLHGSSEPWPAWNRPITLLRHGLITFAGMFVYHLPASAVGWIGIRADSPALLVVAGLLWILGTLMVPGYMTEYCQNFETRVVFDVPRSIRRVLSAKAAYWKAWGITLCAMGCSMLGLLGFGIVFLWTSVWFWQAAAFSFANTMTRTSVSIETTN